MNELVAGIDLCDEYTQVNAMMKRKHGPFHGTLPSQGFRHWSVGEDAYAQTLRGEGSLTDKLVKLVLKEGTATLEGIRYTAVELLERFLERVLWQVKKNLDTEAGFQELVFTVRSLDERLTEALYSWRRKAWCGPGPYTHHRAYGRSDLLYAQPEKRNLERKRRIV